MREPSPHIDHADEDEVGVRHREDVMYEGWHGAQAVMRPALLPHLTLTLPPLNLPLEGGGEMDRGRGDAPPVRPGHPLLASLAPSYL